MILSIQKFWKVINNIKIDEKLYKNILIHCIRYVTKNDSKYAKINSVNPL